MPVVSQIPADRAGGALRSIPRQTSAAPEGSAVGRWAAADKLKGACTPILLEAPAQEISVAMSSRASSPLPPPAAGTTGVAALVIHCPLGQTVPEWKDGHPARARQAAGAVGPQCLVPTVPAGGVALVRRAPSRPKREAGHRHHRRERHNKQRDDRPGGKACKLYGEQSQILILTQSSSGTRTLWLCVLPPVLVKRYHITQLTDAARSTLWASGQPHTPRGRAFGSSRHSSKSTSPRTRPP
mmetsp:Transcript_40546/g.129216  ORF Transcript_40546/g.129216 Transcript_40546/m.129216 type:complete len:241 (+) Transcript_40546:658-1380(+)